MTKRILYLGLDPSHYKTEGTIFHYPIIHIVPRPLSDRSLYQALQNFDDYSHIIITSKSTVTILTDYLPKLGIDKEIWKRKITLAVGQATAAHLKAYGIVPFKIASEETAEGMIQEIELLSLNEAHLFWPHSGQARPVIQNFLIEQQIRHTTCALYDPKPQIPDHLPDLDNFDEIVFTSPSTVDAFLKIFGAFPSHIQISSIGPVTARYLNSNSSIVT